MMCHLHRHCHPQTSRYMTTMLTRNLAREIIDECVFIAHVQRMYNMKCLWHTKKTSQVSILCTVRTTYILCIEWWKEPNHFFSHILVYRIRKTVLFRIWTVLGPVLLVGGL